MSLSDLGDLGGFVSAVAVVISLLYLAVQIRQNTRSPRAGAHQSITSHIAELNRTIVKNAEVARLLAPFVRPYGRAQLFEDLAGFRDDNGFDVELRNRWTP
jgi:hypothetical protein